MTGSPLERLKNAATASPSDREPTLCGDIDLRINRDGTWFYHGSPIGRKPLVKLFSTVLRRDENGEYWLQTPVEKARIQVEDAPFVAVEMVVEGSGADQNLRFRTNVDDWVMASEQHPLWLAESVDGELAPYLHVRDRLDALIARSVYYDLVELAEPDPTGGSWRVRSGGTWLPLGSFGPIDDEQPA